MNTSNASFCENKIVRLFYAHKILIFFVPFLIYMANGREIGGGDATPTAFVAIEIAKKGSVFLDDLHDYIPYNKTPSYISEQRGHIVSNYPLFPGIMAAPVFAPFVWLGMIEKGDGDLVWNYLSKLSAAVFTALAGLFMTLTLRRLISMGGALALGAAYTLGTALWPIASQSLWQHGPSVLWWSVCFYALIRVESAAEKRERNRFLLLSGLAAGAAVLCRTINGAGAAVLCLAALHRYRLPAWRFVLPAAVLTTILLSYNCAIFGSWKGGDVVLHSLNWELNRVRGEPFSTPLLFGLAGQTISPSRGMFVFSPFLLFSLWGMAAIWRQPDPQWRIFALTIPAPLIMLIVFSKFIIWWGGNAHYGPRYQIEMYPFLILYIAAVWPRIVAFKPLLYAFILLLAYSIFVQWIGAFCYPSGWAVEPFSVSLDYSRYWDWKYNQIWSCWKSGIKSPFS